MKPEDFDFACSDTFRHHYFEHCGVPDPAESLAELHEKQELERWGEYIINGNPPTHLPTPVHEVERALKTRDHREVIELERKVSGLNKALANHLAEKPKKKTDKTPGYTNIK